MNAQPELSSGLEWAVARWQAEVANRPLVNVHRRSLDDAWRQVIRYFGGDPDALVGPSHDALLAAAPPAQPVPAPVDAAEWLRNNYHAHPNIADLCDAMRAALAAPADEPVDVDAPQGNDHLACPQEHAAAAREADERSPTAFALEFAEYMAKDAERLLEAAAAMFDAQEAYLSADGDEEERRDAMCLAESTYDEHVRGLRNGIYEFRKRAARAAPTGVPQDSEPTRSDE
jgi:hypothetical protein